MPELPEVETIRTQLEDKLVGRKITAVDIRLPKMFHGDKKDVIGAKITDVQRRAKIIILKLDNGKNLVVHLKMTGQLVFGEGTAETISFKEGIPFAGFSLPAKHTHVILRLDKGSLFYNDMRQFGWMKIISDSELKQIHDDHGPEPFGPEFTLEYLTKILSNWGRPVKLLLMDPAKISGIGNIYANETLWCAEISPMKRGRDLAKNKTAVSKLFDCIKKVLETGLKYGGSSAADEAFVNAEGQPGKMQDHFNVYQKDKMPCPRCGATITKSRLGGRGTFFCPKCQK